MSYMISILCMIWGILNDNAGYLIASGIFYLAWILDLRLNRLRVEVKD